MAETFNSKWQLSARRDNNNDKENTIKLATCTDLDYNQNYALGINNLMPIHMLTRSLTHSLDDLVYHQQHSPGINTPQLLSTLFAHAEINQEANFEDSTRTWKHSACNHNNLRASFKIKRMEYIL